MITYEDYIRYHKKGDSNAEEIMVPRVARHLRLSPWDTFRLIYYYAMVYNIPSALHMLLGKDVKKSELRFRTDRRWVQIGDRYERMIAELTPEKFQRLQACTTTQEAYDEVASWWYFARYATTLFLEVYCNAFHPTWTDNVKFKWERGENYTGGAIYLSGTDDPQVLDVLLDKIRRDTGDNSFAIETTLCGLDKINRGKLYDGADSERMLREADESPRYGHIIYACL